MSHILGNLVNSTVYVSIPKVIFSFFSMRNQGHGFLEAHDISAVVNGAGGESRTPDPRITKYPQTVHPRAITRIGMH